MKITLFAATVGSFLFYDSCFASPPAFPHANMMLSDICLGVEGHYVEALDQASVSFTESYKKLDFTFSNGAKIEVLVDYVDSYCKEHKRISVKKTGQNTVEGRGCIVRLDDVVHGIRYKLNSPNTNSNDLLNDLKVIYHCDPTGNKSSFITSGLLDVGRFNLPSVLHNKID